MLIMLLIFYIIPRFDLEFTVSMDLIAVSNGDLLYQVCIQSLIDSGGLEAKYSLSSLFWNKN